MSVGLGIVYKIIHKHSDVVYVGSSLCKTIRHRFQQHKCDYKKYLNGKNNCVSIYRYFEKYGIENFQIILIREYKIWKEKRSSSSQLKAYEQLWINQLRCINKQCAFQPLKKQYQKQYYEDNKPKIALKKKFFYENNKKKIALRIKIYRENNKQKIKQYQKDYYENNKEEIALMNKKYREINKQKINQKQKQYRETNKKKIKLKNKEWYEKNKEQQKIKTKVKTYCYDCDTYIRKTEIQRHYKTIKHLQNTLPVGL
jgi:hypothetical protein